MQKIINIYIFLLFSSFLTALPRFAVQEGESCRLCHVNPNGGGLRNDYGITMTSKEELPRTSGGLLTKNYMGMINDHLRFGGDIRLMNFNIFYTDQVKSSLFPMQSSVYGHWQITEKMAIFAHLDLLRNNNDIWLLWDGFPLGGYLKMGKDIPAYGLKMDDHTSFIRGGNVRKHKLKQEGLIFSPYLSSPGIVEAGFNFGDLYFSQSIANKFIKFSSGGGFDEYLQDKAFTTRVEWWPSMSKINGLLGGSLLQQGTIRFQGIFGGISFGKLTWIGEVDVANKWLSDGTALASLSELTFDFIPGMDFLLKIDFFDEDIDAVGGAIQRLTIGAEYFPVPFVEIKCQVRFTDLTGESNMSRPELLLQFHTWF